MPTIPSYPSPAGALKASDLVVGWIDDQTVKIRVSDLSDAISSIVTASVAANMSAYISQFLGSLPDEANGDAVPAAGSGGWYLSAGELKRA